MTDETDIQTGPVSFGDQLRAAFAASSEDAEAAAETASAPDEEVVEVEVADAAPDEAEVGEGSDSLSAPDDWSADDRTLFSSLGRTAQEFLLRRHKEMEAGVTKRFQEAADIRKRFEPLSEVLKPHEQRFAMSGVSPAQAVQQLLAAQDFMQKDPSGFLRWAQDYARSRGVEMAAPADEYTDPEIAALKRELEALKSERQRDTRAAQENSQAESLRAIEEFRDAKGEDGELAHPHFEDLRQEMSGLMLSGKAATLDDAYDMALWASPKFREGLMEARIAAKESEIKAQAEKDKKAKLAKAHKQPPLTGKERGGETVKPKTPLTNGGFGEDLRAAFREATQ